MILALSSKTALRGLKCPWGVQVVNLINHLLPGVLLLLLLQGHFRQGSLKYSSREREEVGFDLSFLREIREITNVGVVVISLRGNTQMDVSGVSNSALFEVKVCFGAFSGGHFGPFSDNLLHLRRSEAVQEGIRRFYVAGLAFGGECARLVA